MLKLKKGTKLYLGLPYSDNNSKVMQYRFEVANQIAAELMNMGYYVFSPISHSHPISVQCGLPGDYFYWKKWNRSFLEWAEVLIVVKLEGWKRSEGLNGEVDVISVLGKPVITVNPYIEPYNVGK